MSIFPKVRSLFCIVDAIYVSLPPKRDRASVPVNAIACLYRRCDPLYLTQPAITFIFSKARSLLFLMPKSEQLNYLCC
ncbi:hypothetical protein H6F78_03560 [Coleofasciculus sp. FACHB-64]|uniref:hypothetical protein n=1 Tax=Cyanophyceae TaxID=3028117 RepID=UPI001684116E|nr:hypothetical protein [Coleofasciculus sp. FACHB-64]MBD2044718.1 hypothetical protein [Coleofasciculus sp. FACHB-64]